MTNPVTRPDGLVVCVVAGVDGFVAGTVGVVDTVGAELTTVLEHLASPAATAARSAVSIESPQRAFTATHDER